MKTLIIKKSRFKKLIENQTYFSFFFFFNSVLYIINFTSIRVTIAEELPNISRSVIHGVSRIVLTDWLKERLTSWYIYISVDCLENSRNYLNEIIIAYSRTWDFPLSTDNILNNLDDSRCVVYVTTTWYISVRFYIFNY
jgi:hypothetical protein